MEMLGAIFLYRWNSCDGCIYDLAKNKIWQEMAC